jgi:hypothetical protein
MCPLLATRRKAPLNGREPCFEQRDLSRYSGLKGAAFAVSSRCSTGGQIVDRKIFNSKGVQVGVVTGGAIYGLKGHKLYELKGANTYKLSGELVGHLNASHGSAMRLDRSADRLFVER